MSEDSRVIQNLGRGDHITLNGAGPHTPSSTGRVFTHILPLEGSFKALAKNVDPAINMSHLSSDGTYTGGSPKSFPILTYPGNYTEITGDSSFYAIVWEGTPA